MPVFASVNIFNVFSTTDLVGQIITVSLALSSLVTWTVMFGKYFELKRIRELNLAFEQRLRDERATLDSATAYLHHRHIPYGDVFADAIDAYRRAGEIISERGADSVRTRLEHSENAIQRAIARQVLRYESSMIFLATVVTGAPFMGLLGTVWGVMEAFTAVAGQQTATIQTLAPGVSAALLTTVAGLCVAIPSLLGYNFLLGKTKQLTTEIENFSSSLADRIELETQ
ncbi:MotA/TolQ/ExbB proton channel family protein [Geminisphaera colitermitum]|uniref:MotA/TolQ/ExbB proton channel family protein n=1 Tax=Geminisphaera colitermitum TaxID=1148786 RepID=UPI001E4C9D11|nr:MotA/TolQ/ExbB proton channel family protein [Geminisphaera colitermitum]